MAIKFEENFRTIAENLFTLEVSTIFAASISGTKMPPPEHAMLDVVNLFNKRLALLGAPPAPVASFTAGLASFDELRTRAASLLASKSTLGESDRLMLDRIRDNSDQLKGIFIALGKRLNATVTDFTRQQVIERGLTLELLPDEIVVLRKIWEIGTDEIVMQTTIQLDGDVVTRLLPKHVGNKALLDIHQLGVATSIKFWGRLVGILESFVKGVVDLIRGK